MTDIATLPDALRDALPAEADLTRCEITTLGALARDGTLTRWMPREDGTRLVRPRPPYWNIVGRVRCAEIGETATIGSSSSARADEL